MGDNHWDGTLMYLQRNLSPFYPYMLCCLNYYSYFLVPPQNCPCKQCIIISVLIFCVSHSEFPIQTHIIPRMIICGGNSERNYNVLIKPYLHNTKNNSCNYSAIIRLINQWC